MAFEPPPGITVRMRSRSGGCWNLTITMVPPENSTPFGMPFVQITNRPARMTIQDRAMACHFQRTKSKLGLVKICIAADLDAQRRGLALREFEFKQRLRHENRRKQVHEEADRQRGREAADRARAELEQERGRDERRDVRVEQRQEHAVEAGVDRRADATLGR